MRKIIFFELNEVPYSVLDYYVKKYPNSTVAKVLGMSSQYETKTEDEGHLSPWITWPTLHRGVTNVHHHIKDFGENLTEVDAKYPPIWKILEANGVKTGVFASMHSYPPPANYKNYAFYVPDPFAKESTVHPESLSSFQAFNLAMSRKSGRNVDSGIDMKAATSLAVSLPSLGIRMKTLVDVAGQLVNERMQPWARTRRRTYQSVLAFDIFMKLMAQTRPAFTTYFSNHAASAMHRYWAATFPEHYETYNLDKEWQKKYSGEIDFAMHKFDGFLKTLVEFVDALPEYKLAVASSMGQHATKAESLSTELYCKDLRKFISSFGLADNEWEQQPAMHPQYNVKVDSAKASFFAKKLSEVVADGDPLEFRQKDDFFSIDLGHQNLADDFVLVNGAKVELSKLGLTNEAIDDEATGTAYHIPEGSFFVYDPQNKGAKPVRQKGVSTLAIAPSIIENYGLTVPAYMSGLRIKELMN